MNGTHGWDGAMGSRLLELLAPARNLECGMAAINHGADSVYIGGPRFGAREAAGNSVADIEKLVAYAHQFRAKVYVALNTLLTDSEVEEAVRLAYSLYDIGVDALIIHDVGLLAAGLPPIPLHGSTQLDNRSPEKVRFLEKVGFEQVVLARELNLAEIRKIRDKTSIRLEFFVYGALCVSYSGRCLISEVMAERSANRGECAQYCRHSYQLADENGQELSSGRYFLSLQDLDLSDYLGDLITAGIDAFKIEGRLKDISYVKNITAFFREKIDRLIDSRPGLQAASSGTCRFSFTPDPERTFHRGKTTYCLTGSCVASAEFRSPKAIGKQLGKVLESSGRSFSISGNLAIENGDGLCYCDEQEQLVGLRVNKVAGRTVGIHEGRLPPVGSTVYRNRDVAFDRILASSELCRHIPVNFTLREITDGLELTLIDDDGLISTTVCSVASSPATNPGTVSALAAKQLQKSGGTIFSVADVRVTINPMHHYPASVFNQLRRDLLAIHLKRRQAAVQRSVMATPDNTVAWPREAKDGLPHCRNRYARQFLARHGLDVTVEAQGAPPPESLALMTTRYCLRAQLGICPRKNTMVKNADPLVLADKAHRYRLEFDCRHCEMQVKLIGPCC